MPLEDFCRCKPLILKGWFFGLLNLGYGEPIVGLKSFILSPFVDDEHVRGLVRDVLDTRRAMGPEGRER